MLVYMHILFFILRRFEAHFAIIHPYTYIYINIHTYTYVNPIMYVYVCICMYTYTFIYLLIYMHVYYTYIVIYIVRISVVYCMYMYVYTYLHVYFARKVAGRVDTCIYVRIRICVQYTSHIHLIYIPYTYKYIQYTYNFFRTRFFVYVYWCQYMHVYAVY